MNLLFEHKNRRKNRKGGTTSLFTLNVFLLDEIIYLNFFFKRDLYEEKIVISIVLIYV